MLNNLNILNVLSEITKTKEFESLFSEVTKVFEQNQNTSTEKADIEKQISESENIVSYLQNNIFSKFHPKGDSNKVLVLLEVFNSDYKSDLEHYPPIVSYLDLQTNKKVACSAKLFYTWNVLIK